MNKRELLERVHSPGAFKDWRFERKMDEGSQTLVQLVPYVQGLESYAQALKQYVAAGDMDAARNALGSILKHAASVAGLVAGPEAETHCLDAADSIRM